MKFATITNPTSISTDDPCPYAYISMDKNCIKLMRMRRALFRLCADTDLTELVFRDYTPVFMSEVPEDIANRIADAPGGMLISIENGLSGEEQPLDYCNLVMTEDGFYWEAFPAGYDSAVETPLISFADTIAEEADSRAPKSSGDKRKGGKKK
jgi:hypothetical protein